MERVAVITGGAGGMGLAVAKLIGRDHRLVICDVNQERLDDAVIDLQNLGIRCEARQCDITEKESVSALFRYADGLGSLACVIHTAGISPQMASPEAILRVNALGTVNISDVAFDYAAEGFALVNVASMAGHLLPSLLIPGRAYRYASVNPETFLRKILFRCRLMPRDLYKKGMAYSVSKNFVIWYCKTAAAKFGEKGARILSVSPGSFDTEMGRLEEKSGSAEMLKSAALERFGRPEEIAELLAFCASDKASYMTGVDVLCDGGVVAAKV